MILFDTTPPDVTGANAWRKRCLWLDLTVPGTPVVRIYKEGGSPGWENVLKVIPPNTIDTSMIQNAAVTLAKLSVAGGAANQLIRVNAGATGFEFVSLSFETKILLLLITTLIHFFTIILVLLSFYRISYSITNFDANYFPKNSPLLF